MDTYAIRRKNAWASPDEIPGERSKQVADDEFPNDVRWIRSYVIAEEDGTLGSVCIYQATSPEAIREHAQRVGMPADEIWNVADTVIIRPDPARDRHAVATSRGRPTQRAAREQDQTQRVLRSISRIAHPRTTIPG